VTGSRRFLPLLAAAAGGILLHQAVDLLNFLPGSDLATPAGRTRQLLATVARSPALLTADALLIWALLSGGWLRAMRHLGAAHYVLGALSLLALPLFLSDAGRVAPSLSGSDVGAFRLVTVRTLVLLPLLGLGSLLAARALRSMPAPAAADS